MKDKKLNDLHLAEYDEDGQILDIKIQARAEDNLEIILQAIENLIESIEPKDVCNENFDLYNQSINRILFSVADNLGFSGQGYFMLPDIKINYDEYDEGYVMEKDKIKVLKAHLDFISSNSSKV